jgi:hypothetical protein
VEVIFILLVAGCGLTVALTHYAFKPERPEDKLGDYGLEESHEARDGTGDS